MKMLCDALMIDSQDYIALQKGKYPVAAPTSVFIVAGGLFTVTFPHSYLKT